MFVDLSRGIDGIIDSIIENIYFMRGAISYDSMMQMTPGERQRISDFIGKRLEQEAKSPYPVY